MTPLPIKSLLTIIRQAVPGSSPAKDLLLLAAAAAAAQEGEWVVSSSAGPGWGLMWMMWGRGKAGADIHECRRHTTEESERGRERREEGALDKLAHLQGAVFKKVGREQCMKVGDSQSGLGNTR